MRFNQENPRQWTTHGLILILAMGSSAAISAAEIKAYNDNIDVGKTVWSGQCRVGSFGYNKEAERPFVSMEVNCDQQPAFIHEVDVIARIANGGLHEVACRRVERIYSHTTTVTCRPET